MTYRIEIKEEAVEDIRLAVDFYQDTLHGLGDDFLAELEYSINIIKKNPLLFEQKHKPFRELKTRRFPYLIIYEVEPNAIIIYAVFHTKRSPDRKYKLKQ